MNATLVGWPKALIFFLLLVLSCPIYAPVIPVMENGFIQIPEQDLIRLNVSDEVEAFLDSSLIGSLNGGVLVMHQGHPIYSKTEGFANVRSKEKLTYESPFQLASVSKMFTAVAILKLQEQGLIDLDCTVQSYLPEWPYADQTLRHLLNHRSGLPRYMAVADWYWDDPKRPMLNSNVIEQYAEHAPQTFFSPDSGFNYCNSNYVVLAEIVSRVTGGTFQEFVDEQIFCSLGMHRAFVYSKADSTLNPEVKGYRPGRRGYYEAWKDYIDGVWGDKNIYASLEDLQKFDAALWNGSLLSDSSMQEMWTPGSPQRQYNYGLGWRLRVTESEKTPYHFGWWRGFRSCYIHDPESGISLIMLSNMDDSRRLPGYWETFETLKNIWPVLQDS